MKCPNCGEEIPYLINEYIEEVMVYEVIPDTNGKILYFRVGSKPVSDSMSITNIPEINLFYCPECKALLFDNEEDAEAFLRGELDGVQEED